MKTFIKYYLLIFLLSSSKLILAQPELQLVNIGDFATTNGSIIKDCEIGYRTVGKINSDSSNVILWPTWFGGTSEDITKPRNLPRWIDSTGFYIIVVDALTDGVSSSPSNTTDFPEVSIRDMVNSQHELLVNHLNINHLYAIIGVSMGGMQTFEWLVAYPDFMDKGIPVIGSPKQSSYDIFVWQSQADLIKEAGTDEQKIELAMKRAYDICNMNSYTPSFFVKRVEPERMNKWRSSSYRRMMNSKDYHAGLKAMLSHDIYKSSAINPENISDHIKADVLIVVSIQDHLVNPASSITISKLLNCNLVELSGDCGHGAFLCEAKKIREAVSSFLNEDKKLKVY